MRKDHRFCKIKKTMANSSKPGTRTSARKGEVRSDAPLDQLIHEGGLRIVDVEPLQHQGLLVVMLNSGTPLMVRTEHCPRLAKAKADQLSNWRIIADGTAIGWDQLDEHLSLKGFLMTEVRNQPMARLRTQWAQRPLRPRTSVTKRTSKPAPAKRKGLASN
jgi:hypothetical protein